ncbi:MAG: serine/threonine protein kinase [Proteobacteria bacterium]|nr:serine/threonine protein kinase [Pseudomonadota bacterium]
MNTSSRSSLPEQPTVLDLDAAADDGRQTLQPGQGVGPYRIERLLGEGGMGAVYLAEQIEPIQRRVALKLIRAQLRSSLAEAYFMVERQALARMDHPAIARVYDAGTTPQGHLFFAMEWIDGTTLSAFCAAHDLPLRGKLELFTRICRGVQHAHQKGVIHRDLKPSNVLVTQVDGEPAPKIIDFGIAVGSGQSNAAGDHATDSVGTRGYMSPEQRSGKSASIDIRTDVYALGMILLEMLAPAPLRDAIATAADDDAAFHALRASLHLRADVPAAWKDGLQAIPQELRWVLLRAIDPDRTHRYDSAQALADDLDRFLHRYPLVAAPATRAYRLRCFAARNRGPLLASAAIVVALVAGILVAVMNMRRAQIEAAKAHQVSAFLTDVLSGVDPEKARGMDKSLLRLILDDAAKNADAKLAGQPEVLADIKGTIGLSYRALSEYKIELDFIKHAQALAIATLGANAQLSLDLQRQLARAYADNGDFATASTLIDANIAAWTKQQGTDGPKALISGLDRVQYIWYAGDSRKALAELTPLLPRIQRVLGPENPSTVDALNVQAVLTSETGQYAQAEPLFQNVLAMEKRLYGPNAPKTLDSMNDLAVMYLQSQRYAQGEELLKELLQRDTEIYGADSAMVNNVVSNLAGALRQQGTPQKIAESGPYYKQAYDYALRRFGPKHPNTIIAKSNYANYFSDTGDLDNAIELDTSALADLGTHRELANIRGEIDFQLGVLLAKTGKFADAETHLLAGNAEKARELGADHWRMAEYDKALVDLYTKWNKPEQAAHWQSVLGTLKTRPPGES